MFDIYPSLAPRFTLGNNAISKWSEIFFMFP